MSEKRAFVCGECRWKLFLAAIVGGFVGAAADDLGTLLFATRTDPWVAECEAMLEHEMDRRRDRSYFTDGSICVAVLYPEVPDRDRIRRDAPYQPYRTVLDAHEAALQAEGSGGEVQMRFQIDVEGAPVDPEIVESTGAAAMEAFALELATTMMFSPATNGDASPPTWAEYSVAVGVRPQ